MSFRNGGIENNKRDYREELIVVFRLEYNNLCYFASRITQDMDVAEDVVQEVFTRLYEHGKLPEDLLSLKPYLYKMVRNQCLDYLKHRKVVCSHQAAGIGPVSEEYILTSIAEAEALSLISEAIDQLPSECGKIFNLLLEGYSTNEIAEKTDLAPSTIRAQKRRGIELLRKKLPVKLFFIFLRFCR